MKTSSCLFTCTYASGFGNSQTWTASASVTDSQGNVLTNLGTGHTVVVKLGGGGAASMVPASPATLTIAGTGPATSTAQLTYTSPAHGPVNNTLTATGTGYTSATASFK